MRDFDDWAARQAGSIAVPEYGTSKPAFTELIAKERELPDGVSERPDGVYWARCRSCEQDYEILWDIWKEGFDPDMSYCGGSPRCLP